MRSTILLIFAILFIFNEGLSQSLQKPIFEKKIKQEINIDYKPFYTFSNIDRIQGTYHPLKLQQSITHTYEITYGSIIKHLKIEFFGKRQTIKLNL